MDSRYRADALLRLKTVRGHLDGVISMVEREDYCPDVMKQVAALQASLEKINRILLQNHLETCVTQAIQEGGGKEKIQELIDALRYNSSLTNFRHLSEEVGNAEACAPNTGESGASASSPRQSAP